MSCTKILDMVFDYSGSEMPLLNQIQVWIHTFFCPECSLEIERYSNVRTIMREGFFKDSPNFEDAIMNRIAIEEETEELALTNPGGFSTRSWVIAGLAILISLATVFLGFDFKMLTSENGMSLMLPIGITIGIVLTTYGAFFIGSHLKELSERFGL